MAARSTKIAAARQTKRSTIEPPRAVEPDTPTPSGPGKRKDKKAKGKGKALAKPGDAKKNDAAKSVRKAKAKKSDKVVRDSFTMPAREYERIGALKKRCLALGVAARKSELLRAGLAMVDQLPDDRLTQVVMSIESVKTGRPPRKTEKGG
jgi:hypothetical protein